MKQDHTTQCHIPESSFLNHCYEDLRFIAEFLLKMETKNMFMGVSVLKVIP
jgi:hypothetical protein